MDILKRSMAPLTQEAWAEIDAEATRALRENLSARKLIDFEGPAGLDLAMVNLGRVKRGTSSAVDGVQWGVREVLPLTEIRVPFTLNLWDLDDISRGAKDPALDAVTEAAAKAALFEERAVYHGFKEGKIKGIISESPHKPVGMAKSPGKVIDCVQQGIGTLREAHIGGDCALVLGGTALQMVNAGDERGYPLRKRLEEMVGGGIYWSPALDCGALISQRGGDYEMTVGQDLAIGYHVHDKKEVELFLTESFTFQILEPAAAVVFKWQS